MKNILRLMLMLFALGACVEKQKDMEDYEQVGSTLQLGEFISNNGEFSLLLPGAWHKNENAVDSDTMLYRLETGPNMNNNGLCGLVVYKLNLTKGNMDDEFDWVVDNFVKKVHNAELIEKSTLKIGSIEAKTAHLAYTHDGKILQEEIDLFIPINKKQYYHLGLISDKNEQIETNFGLMLKCAKTFKMKQ